MKVKILEEYKHPYLFEYQDENDSTVITLWTYTNSEDKDGLKFTVDRSWLNKIIINEFGYDTEDEFLADYTFDLSHEILRRAEQEKTLS